MFELGAPVICLCGSTKFKDLFYKYNREFTLKGYIVVMPGVFAHSGDEITEEQKLRLDELHKWKITMSEAIFVINKDGYIGQSTKSEIEFAENLGIKVIYMEEKKEN